MFLSFQTQQDIRNEIIESFARLDRPATIGEVVSKIWSRSAIDGTREGVNRTVNAEVRRMMQDGILECERYENSTHYFRISALDQLARIKPS